MPKPSRSQAPQRPAPGRPKDLAKRASILEAAKCMFLGHGFEGVSMDQIAAAAGVSKLTVYSHFGDKGALFTEAARSWCEQQMPVSLFERAPHLPVRERLMDIAHSYFTMVCSPEAVAGHRLLCSPQMVGRGRSQSAPASASRRVTCSARTARKAASSPSTSWSWRQDSSSPARGGMGIGPPCHCLKLGSASVSS